MDIKPIRSLADLEAVEAEIFALMDAGVEPGTPEGDRLDVLATLAEAYESKAYPIGLPEPIEALWARIEATPDIIQQLPKAFGGEGIAARVLARREPLTLPMIRELAVLTGLPLEVLAQPYELAPPPPEVEALLARRAA